MRKSKGFLSILIPSATVFISSGCIMVLELVAGRLIARYLGSSLYTWTSVIGVVLAGITIGNYLGGRIADRFNAGKTLAVLFGICSVSCVVTVVSNNLVGDWVWLWGFGWPVRVFSHVALVFLLPSTLLGMISPVVAKMALDRGLPTGRTVGDIYAWGAAGSIAGTFLAGFYLIATMGTIAIIWTVGAVLLLMAILYWTRLWVLYVWAILFVLLMTMGMAPAGWAQAGGSSVGLREKTDPSIIYQDESQYCHIAVRQLSENPDKRLFIQDGSWYSRMVMDDVTDLQFAYVRIYAAATHLFSRPKDRLSTLTIGGGGCIFPRYVEQLWPGSRVDVVEIDAGVTKAAMEAFGLDSDTSINIFTMDARNYVDQLLQRGHTGEEMPEYDFIYEDAFNALHVPFQLVTKQFNDKIARILTSDGLYMVNLIDVFDEGRFLAGFVNTLARTFSNVYVVCEIAPRSGSSNFVVIAAKREINLEDLGAEEAVKDLNLWILDGYQMQVLKQKAGGIVLTDDYAPVENLLAPAVLATAKRLAMVKYLEEAQKLRRRGKPNQSISKYEDVIDIYPPASVNAYSQIEQILAEQGEWAQVLDAAKSALEYNAGAEVKQSMSDTYYTMAAALKSLGRNIEFREYLRKAIKGYRQDLAKEPDSVSLVSRLGNALAVGGDFEQATEFFQQAVDMDPRDVKNHSILAKALVAQGLFDAALEQLQKGVRFMSEHDQQDDAAKLRRYIELVEFQKSKHNE